VAVSLLVVPLPTCAPERNRTERVWRVLRPVIEAEPNASLEDKQARVET
jgi:transposase